MRRVAPLLLVSSLLWGSVALAQDTGGDSLNMREALNYALAIIATLTSVVVYLFRSHNALLTTQLAAAQASNEVKNARIATLEEDLRRLQTTLSSGYNPPMTNPHGFPMLKDPNDG